jgi:hypothetical protein
MAGIDARLAALERRQERDGGRPRVVTVIYHPGQPPPPHEPAEVVISMPCNGRGPCLICDAEQDR